MHRLSVMGDYRLAGMFLFYLNRKELVCIGNYLAFRARFLPIRIRCFVCELESQGVIFAIFGYRQTGQHQREWILMKDAA